MKPRRSNQTNQALTLMEVLVIVAVLILFASMIGVPTSADKQKALRISCLNNLRQIGLAYRVWAGDHSGQYPMQASITNNGTMELLSAEVPASQLFLWNIMVMSNELATPKLLHCPVDTHPMATSFSSGFSITNISYFLSRDATEDYPQMILSGDNNLTINGTPINPGFLDIPTNATVAWTNERHHNGGNIGFADGSAQEVSDAGLQRALQQTGAATNHLAIP